MSARCVRLELPRNRSSMEFQVLFRASGGRAVTPPREVIMQMGSSGFVTDAKEVGEEAFVSRRRAPADLLDLEA